MKMDVQTIQALLNTRYNADATCEQVEDYLRRMLNILKVLAEIKAGDSKIPQVAALSIEEGEYHAS